MNKSDLGDQAFVRKKDYEGNPYQGSLTKGISYDDYESQTSTLVQEGSSQIFLPVYRRSARKLVNLLQASNGQKVLDVGSGTGISTLEIFLQSPEISVLSIEISEGMMDIARFKFNQLDNLGHMEGITNKRLLKYWGQFRAESKPYRNDVEFILGDIEVIDEIDNESIDVAVGNQSLHWTDLSKSFGQLNRLLKRKGRVIFNSASDFCEDENFPSLKYCFLYNEFIRHVTSEVGKTVKLTSDYRSLSRPKHNINSFKEIAYNAGFELKQINTDLIPVDLQTIILNHMLPIVRQLCDEKELESRQDIKEITEKAIAKTVNNPKAMNDLRHKYGINPIFEMTKKNTR